MEFKVNFIGVEAKKDWNVRGAIDSYFLKKNWVNCISLNSKKIGLELLKELNITAEDVKNNEIKSIYKEKYSIIINQKTADESDLFKKSNVTDVEVSYKFLNDFSKIALENNEIIYKIDDERLIKFWMESGYQVDFTDKEILEKVQKEIEEDNKRIEKERLEEEVRKEQEKTEKEKIEEDRKNWIEQNGSEHLKKCYELDYKCNKEYVTERASKEFADFEVDYSENAEWESKVSPSMQALIEVENLIKEGHQAKIVWLTKGIKYIDYRDYDDTEDYDEATRAREAIVIRKYLGKYDLIKVL